MLCLASLVLFEDSLIAGCGKLSVFFSDGCEVGYSDVVGEGFEVEFASLGCSLVTGGRCLFLTFSPMTDSCRSSASSKLRLASLNVLPTD